jgi:dienelactone hydrolase
MPEPPPDEEQKAPAEESPQGGTPTGDAERKGMGAVALLALLAGAHLVLLLAALSGGSSRAGNSLDHALLGLLYGGLGFLAHRRSRAALAAAIALQVVDLLLRSFSAIGEGKGFPVISLVIAVLLVSPMIRALVALRSLPEATEGRIARRALLAALLIVETFLVALGLFNAQEARAFRSIVQAPAGEFQARRAAYATRLTRQGPAPESPRPASVPPGVEEVHIPSGPGPMLGWYLRPANPPAPDERLRAVVYFHGGFALTADDLPEAQPFREAGYAVLFASLRGEDGNPGSFELMYGELEDAAAAVRWLAARPEVDPARVVAFGHSLGGGVSALLALAPGLPLRASGSAGGLYPEAIFRSWQGLAPFDVGNAQERRLRLLLPHLASMQRPHLAYLGQDDELSQLAGPAIQAARALRSPLTVTLLPGDHHSSLRAAEEHFIVESSQLAP